jgi:phage tail sheath protein FI
MVFLSPLYSDVVEQTNSSTATTNATGYYNDELSKSSSYGVMDSGWKYQYDPYNDVYRWIPLNADVAGLCARTEFNQDAWFSPAGFNRGRIRNVVKLAFQPQKADRDNLYKNNLNPVVTFPGEGTILFGDKTMQRKPSAFDRINVRRLFIILEKAISTAAKYQLFEFNDEFTRANFINMVEPFLRDVQGRRGITDFRVICDETNNTSGVIDRNEFVADIYVKPNRSINYIQLNFVAVGSGVAFNEIAG